MRSDKYILHGKIPVPTDLMTWARWCEDHRDERIVSQENIGPFWVSTVFMGLDYNFADSGPPLLFETMVFDTRTRHLIGDTGIMSRGDDVWCTRTATWELALDAHREAMAWAKEQLT